MEDIQRGLEEVLSYYKYEDEDLEFIGKIFKLKEDPKVANFISNVGNSTYIIVFNELSIRDEDKNNRLELLNSFLKQHDFPNPYMSVTIGDLTHEERFHKVSYRLPNRVYDILTPTSEELSRGLFA